MMSLTGRAWIGIASANGGLSLWLVRRELFSKRTVGLIGLECNLGTTLKGSTGSLKWRFCDRTLRPGLGLPPIANTVAHDPGGQVTIEITRGDHVLFTCQSRKVHDFGSKAVTQEETPSQVWEERLRNHIRHSTNIFLVDVYAARRWSGLQFFLEKLVTDGRQPGDTLQTVHILLQLQGVQWYRLRVCCVYKAATSRRCHPHEHGFRFVCSKPESSIALVSRT